MHFGLLDFELFNLSVEPTLKISVKKREKTAIAIDELSMFIASIANFIDRLSLIWLISSGEIAIQNYQVQKQ